MDAREKRALYLARHQAKGSPAGRRMRGEELAAWRRQWFQWHLDREGLSEFFAKYEPLATKTRDEDIVRASHQSDAARYRRAYGPDKPRRPSTRKLVHESRDEYVSRLESMGLSRDEIYKKVYGR